MRKKKEGGGRSCCLEKKKGSRNFYITLYTFQWGARSHLLEKGKGEVAESLHRSRRGALRGLLVLFDRKTVGYLDKRRKRRGKGTGSDARTLVFRLEPPFENTNSTCWLGGGEESRHVLPVKKTFSD